MAIEWPATWATLGYTTLTLGFDSAQEVAAWHAALVRLVQGLQHHGKKGSQQHSAAVTASSSVAASGTAGSASASPAPEVRAAVAAGAAHAGPSGKG